jgi:hypothetical protein
MPGSGELPDIPRERKCKVQKERQNLNGKVTHIVCALCLVRGTLHKINGKGVIAHDILNLEKRTDGRGTAGGENTIAGKDFQPLDYFPIIV